MRTDCASRSFCTRARFSPGTTVTGPAPRSSARLFPSSLNQGQDRTEPDTVLAEVRPEGVVALRRPAVPAIVAPTAPSKHAVRARRPPLGIRDAPSRKRTFPPVQTPFPDVPVHVMQAPRIGPLGPHRLCCVVSPTASQRNTARFRAAPTVVPIPRILSQLAVPEIIPIAKTRRCPTVSRRRYRFRRFVAASVSWQTTARRLESVELHAPRHRIIPVTPRSEAPPR